MKSLESLLKTFVELHPQDAARAFESLAETERVRLAKTLPQRVLSELLEHCNVQIAAALLAGMDPTRTATMLGQLPPRVASSILHQCSQEDRERLLTTLEPTVAKPLRELAGYPDDTAGAIMDPKVASISIDLTIQQAIASVRKAPRDSLYYLYVTGRDGTLRGVVNMRDLLLSSPRDRVESIVRKDVLSVADTTNCDEVVNLMRERGFLAMPVVDFDGRLVGVVKHGEALQAGQEAVFEDLQKIVGAGADERALSPVSLVVKSRLPWLFINLLTAFMAAAVVGVFEGIIAQVAALAVLLPVVAGQGGNTGSQSLAVVMRGIALREVIPGTKKRLIKKELAGGIINGVAVALITAIAVLVWRVLSGDTTQAGIGLSLVIGLAMIVNMAAAAFSGAIIPLVLQKLGRDPAQSAAIFLTTVTDIVGFASFLGFASAFMPMITAK